MQLPLLFLRSINSITLLTPPPPPTLSSSSLSSVTIYPLSHFIFPLRCPDFICPFYLPPVFAAISPLPRLSLILVSPGFLSPRWGGEGVRQEVTDDTYANVLFLIVTSRLLGRMDEHFSVSIPACHAGDDTPDGRCHCLRQRSTHTCRAWRCRL